MGLGRLTFSDTGRPIGGHPLFVGADEYCPGSFERVTTNADGRYQFRMLGFDFACVSMIAPEPSGDRYDYLNVALIHYRVVRPEGEITPPPTNAAGLEPVGTEAALSPGLVLLAAALSLVALGRRVRTSEHTPASR